MPKTFTFSDAEWRLLAAALTDARTNWLALAQTVGRQTAVDFMLVDHGKRAAHLLQRMAKECPEK